MKKFLSLLMTVMMVSSFSFTYATDKFMSSTTASKQALLKQLSSADLLSNKLKSHAPMAVQTSKASRVAAQAQAATIVNPANVELIDLTSSGVFQFYGEDSKYIASVAMLSNQLVGTYGTDDMYIDDYGYTYTYVGIIGANDTTWVDAVTVNATVAQIDGGYALNATMIGNDSKEYQIQMTYVKPVAKDTIEVTMTNLEISSFSLMGLYLSTITASNSDYALELDVLDYSPIATGTYGTESFYAGELVKLSDNTAIEMMEISANINVSGATPQMEAWYFGDDLTMYHLQLSFVLPTATDTVQVNFTNPGAIMYYAESGDYQFVNMNTEYIVSLDIYTKTLPGQYNKSDIEPQYSGLYKIVNNDTIPLTFYAADITIAAVDDTTYQVNAGLLASDNVFYQLSSKGIYKTYSTGGGEGGLDYDATSGEVNRTYTANDNVEFIDGTAQYGQIALLIDAADNSDGLCIYFFSKTFDQTTGAPAGTYAITSTGAEGTVLASIGLDEDYYLTPSYYAIMDEEGYVSTPYFLVSGTVVVEKKNNVLKLTVDALNSNGVAVKVSYEGPKSTDIEEVKTNKSDAYKFIENGNLVIKVNGQEYNALGTVIK
jgi:hypothetical protein